MQDDFFNIVNITGLYSLTNIHVSFRDMFLPIHTLAYDQLLAFRMLFGVLLTFLAHFVPVCPTHSCKQLVVDDPLFNNFLNF